jgi:hypothetical protein
MIRSHGYVPNITAALLSTKRISLIAVRKQKRRNKELPERYNPMCIRQVSAVWVPWFCSLSVTTKLGTQAHVMFCGICGGRSGTEAGFLRVLRLTLPILIPPTAPHSSYLIRSWYNRPVSGRRTKWSPSRCIPRNWYDEDCLCNVVVLDSAKIFQYSLHIYEWLSAVVSRSGYSTLAHMKSIH